MERLRSPGPPMYIRKLKKKKKFPYMVMQPSPAAGPVQQCPVPSGPVPSGPVQCSSWPSPVALRRSDREQIMEGDVNVI